MEAPDMKFHHEGTVRGHANSRLSLCQFVSRLTSITTTPTEDIYLLLAKLGDRLQSIIPPDFLMTLQRTTAVGDK